VFDDVDRWQFVFIISAALFVAYQMVRGWRVGIVRQAVNLFALILAYAVAIFGGRLAVPVLRPFGYPDFVVSLIIGSIMALLVFAAISMAGRILFRRTNQQGIGLLRLGYGVGGSAIGMVFGFFTVWLVVLGIRLLGTVAETEMDASRPAPRKNIRIEQRYPMFAQNMAHMKQSLDQGPTGAFVQAIDPIPERAYDIIAKVGRVVSREESIERFLTYPGAKHLSQHPRIIALQNDPSVVHAIEQRNYFALLKNQRIVAAVNDPEVSELIRKFDLDKALDYALAK